MIRQGGAALGQTKLIILRGPSGSGKSTVAKMLFDGAVRRTALIEQDHYRFIFKPPGVAANLILTRFTR